MENQERKAVSINTQEFEHAILEAEIFCRLINKILSECYELGISKLNSDDISVILNVILKSYDVIINTIRNLIIIDDSNLDTQKHLFAINSLSYIINQVSFVKSPFDLKYYKINESGMLQIGDRKAISDLFTVFLETPKQKEFYKLMVDTRKNLARMFELRQQSEAANFKFHSFGEFMGCLSRDVFFQDGEVVRFNPEYVREID